ncbi:helix-turn-helix domain-containing protein [Chitinimonas naiadis]
MRKISQSEHAISDDPSTADQHASEIDSRLALRLASLRQEHGWSLDELAEKSGISRATLSRMERCESSPTASLLGRLCTAYGRTMSRLLAEVEAAPVQHTQQAGQAVWVDPASGFIRRSVSPPSAGYRVDLIEGEIPAGAVIRYDTAPVPGVEQHIWMLSGVLDYTLGNQTFTLQAGDCLSFRLFGATRFHNPGSTPARYLIAMGRP